MKQMIQLAFRQLLSPEEREIKKYIHTYGGIEGVMKDNARMERMLEMSRSNEDDRTDKDAGQMTVTEFQAELLKDIQVVLEENAKALDNKFQLMLAELGKMEGVVQRESNRTVEEIIKAMRDGPHGRIVDCVSNGIFHKGSCPNHLIQFVQDVFHVWTQNVCIPHSLSHARHYTWLISTLGMEGQRQGSILGHSPTRLFFRARKRNRFRS